MRRFFKRVQGGLAATAGQSGGADDLISTPEKSD